jgi:hypothetical protein
VYRVYHRIQKFLKKKQRHKFTAKYKLSILSEADLCSQPGQVGDLLRREGLYSSHLTIWRRQRKEGLLDALSPKKRGAKKLIETRWPTESPDLKKATGNCNKNSNRLN